MEKAEESLIYRYLQELAPASFSDWRYGEKQKNIFLFKKAEISDIINFWTRILKSKECSGDAAHQGFQESPP